MPYFACRRRFWSRHWIRRRSALQATHRFGQSPRWPCGLVMTIPHSHRWIRRAMTSRMCTGTGARRRAWPTSPSWNSAPLTAHPGFFHTRALHTVRVRLAAYLGERYTLYRQIGCAQACGRKCILYAHLARMQRMGAAPGKRVHGKPCREFESRPIRMHRLALQDNDLTMHTLAKRTRVRFCLRFVSYGDLGLLLGQPISASIDVEQGCGPFHSIHPRRRMQRP
jgi:hypothetical protein